MDGSEGIANLSIIATATLVDNDDVTNIDSAHSQADTDSVSDVSSVRGGPATTLSHDSFTNIVYDDDNDSDDEGWFGSCRDFKLKLFQLCIDIGLGMPSNVSYASEDTGKSYYITFSDDCKPDYILKIGSSYLETTEGNNAEVAVLLYLQRFEFLCSPVVVAWDNEGDNAIKTPYIIMEKLPGQNFCDFYYDLKLAEKVDVALVIAEYMSKMETLTFDRAGALRARDSETHCLPWNSPFTPRFSLPVEIEVGPFKKEQFDSLLDVVPVKEEPLHSWLLRILDHKLFIYQKDGVPPNREDADLQAVRIMRYIVRREFKRENFEKVDAECFLTHQQLKAEDFFMTKSDDGWKITGVLGWRGARSLPAVLARNACDFLTADAQCALTTDARPYEWQDVRRAPFYHWRNLNGMKSEPQFTDEEHLVRARFFSEMSKRCCHWLTDITCRNDIRNVGYWAIYGIIRHQREEEPQTSFLWGYLDDLEKTEGLADEPIGLFIHNNGWRIAPSP
jgi:hypothetical protein